MTTIDFERFREWVDSLTGEEREWAEDLYDMYASRRCPLCGVSRLEPLTNPIGISHRTFMYRHRIGCRNYTADAIGLTSRWMRG